MFAMFALIDFGLAFILFIVLAWYLLSKLGETAKTEAGKTAINGFLERLLKK